MKKWLILLLFLPVVLGQSLYESDELILDVSISNILEVEPEKSDYSLSSVSVHLSFYPREDFRQEIEYMETTPEKKTSEELYIFKWDNPSSLHLTFEVNAHIHTYNKLRKVSKKPDFPIKELGSGLKQYIYETPTIDYTDKDIMHLASDMAYGEEDLYVVVHKLGSWVNKNINYDLNTKTADASQKASWVMENREGVCDEITNLFIGLCRALGIPTRFVSGLSYSDLEIFSENWSPHGWAEVYFPGYGWIPFDVTYGELGFIDPTHIKLKDSVDANKSSTKYMWEGYNVGLNINSLSMTTEVVDAIGMWNPLLVVDTLFMKEKIGFGSYNAIVVELENPHSYYVPTELTISRSEGIQTFDDYGRFILMKPFEKKKAFWLIKLEPGQRRNYIYNFTTKAYTTRNASMEAHMLSTQEYKRYTKEEIELLIAKQTEEEEKTYSESVSLTCTAEEQYYVKESAKIDCELKNIGNVNLVGLEVCLVDCKVIDITIGQAARVSFDLLLEEPGAQDMVITAKNEQVTKTDNVQFSVWSRPQVLIDEMLYPEYVSLSDKFTIEFSISPKSDSLPIDVHVFLSSDAFEKEWSLEELSQNRKYILNVDENTLTDIDNRFQLLVTYSDMNGRKFSDKKEFAIKISDVTLKQRAIMLLNKINVQLQYDIVILSIAVFVAGLVIGLIFKIKQSD